MFLQGFSYSNLLLKNWQIPERDKEVLFRKPGLRSTKSFL